MVKKSKKDTTQNSDVNNAKQQVLDDALKSIEKQFWKWAVMKLWDDSVHSIVKTYHSGSFMLDNILWGGYPEWRVIEIYGR